jgi:hypothetical protein
MSDIKIKFSDKLTKVLKTLEDSNNYVAFEMLYLVEPGSKYFNGLRISNVDLGKNFTFLVTIDGKDYYMKVGKFLRYYFKDIFNDDEISKFSHSYNEVKNGGTVTSTGKKITVGDFEYKPSNPRSTFLSMVTKTYPHGHEEEVLQFLPKLSKDEYGNYYTIIGSNKPTTMFTSHLDTADREQKVTSLYSKEDDNGDEIIYTDGSTILGADDKSGVTVMLYMMDKGVQGLYYFFVGEERGGIGSNKVSADYDSIEYLKDIKRCVSFDRRKTISVITQQLGRVCCSNEFGTALCKEYGKSGINFSLDPTGIYTDSASFIDDIPECTNISVGYENEHTGRELQNMTFLTKLCEASVKVDWNSLPTARKVGLNQELVKKHKNLIDDIKKSAYGLEVKMMGFEDTIYINIDLDDSDIETAYDSLVNVQVILNKHKVNDDVYIHDSYLKIQLR